MFEFIFLSYSFDEYFAKYVILTRKNLIWSIASFMLVSSFLLLLWVGLLSRKDEAGETLERGAASLSLTSISVVFIMSHTKALLVPTFRCTPLSLHFYTQTCNTAFPGKWERLNTRARYVCTSTHTYIHNVTCQKDGWPN